MKFTYEQMRALAGMTAQDKMQVKDKKGRVLKPTIVKWTDLSRSIQGPQKPTHVATASLYPTCPVTFF